MTAFALMTRGSLILTSQRYKFWVIIPSVDKPDDLLTNLIMPDGCYIALVVIRNCLNLCVRRLVYFQL